MNNPDIAPKDKFMARVFQAASIAANRSLVLSNLITEPYPKIASYKSVLWFPGHIATSSIDKWVTFAGDRDAGHLPSQYKRAGVIIFERAPIDDEYRQSGGRHAVAFALGSAVMIGLANNTEDEIFGIDPNNINNYATALRIGKGTLQVTTGLWSERKGYSTPSQLSIATPNAGLKLRSIDKTIPLT